MILKACIQKIKSGVSGKNTLTSLFMSLNPFEMIEDSNTGSQNVFIIMRVAIAYTCENYFKSNIFIDTLQKEGA